MPGTKRSKIDNSFVLNVYFIWTVSEYYYNENGKTNL